MSLRRGMTTGTCAAAAAKAAAIVLTGGAAPAEVEVRLPSGDTVRVSILFVEPRGDGTGITAAVRKDAGDDPDVTHGLTVQATLSWDDAADVRFIAGEGVGTVTKPGLQVPPGQPAINPVPRKMIAAAIRDVTPRGVRVEISILGGREIAAQTFNPRLGIEGGLSILGTTGIVRPYCTRALHDAMKCSLDVATACGVTSPVLVPGNIGLRAAHVHFSLRDEQVVEVGNEWGFVLDLLARYPFQAVLILGHPGKLAKLAVGQWDTHSARSHQAVEYLGRLYREVFARPAPESPTAEGLFAALESGIRPVPAEPSTGDVGRIANPSSHSADLPDGLPIRPTGKPALSRSPLLRQVGSRVHSPAALERDILGDALAQRIRQAIAGTHDDLAIRSPNAANITHLSCEVAVLLVNMAGERLGSDGDFTPWQ